MRGDERVTMVGRGEIERRLGYHPANDPARVAAFELIRQRTIELAELYDEVCPPGRELAEALTNLQTAQQYAIGAVACHAGEYEAPASVRSSAAGTPPSGGGPCPVCERFVATVLLDGHLELHSRRGEA